VAALKVDVVSLTGSVTTLAGDLPLLNDRLREHLAWEERERLNDVEHRKRSSAERSNQFHEIAVRLDSLDARMATVEHAAH
jgi:hypothetical protein